MQTTTATSTTKRAHKAKSVKKRQRYNGNLVISVLAKENPKRPKSRAFTKFMLLMKNDGKTIKDFKAQEGHNPKLDAETGWPAKELRYSVNLGLIKLVRKQ